MTMRYVFIDAISIYCAVYAHIKHAQGQATDAERATPFFPSVTAVAI